MFSYVRLGYILIITIIISFLFFLFNLDNEFIKTSQKNTADLIENPVIVQKTIPYEIDESKFVIVGDPVNGFEENVKTNVIYTISQLKKEYVFNENLELDLLGEEDVVIFVITDIRESVNLEAFGDYIKNGGKVIFAAGLPNNNNLNYLNPIWGVMELGGFKNYDSIRFINGSIPYDEITLEKSYTSFSANLRLNSTCEVLIESEDENPLVWENKYFEGKCSVINGTYLDNKFSCGILVSAIANMEEHFIYPIIGVKTVFLDAIPPLYNGNDENSFKYYGRSAESFVRDKLWAVLLQKASLMELKYTASFLGIDRSNLLLINANRQTFAFINKQIIQNGGEISLSGDHNDLENLDIQKVEKVKFFFNEFFPNYNIHAYYPLYGVGKIEDIQIIASVFDKINILRSMYYGDEENQTIGNFEVYEQFISFPTISNGYKADGTQTFNFLSALTFHGIVSHSFDINSLFTIPENESNWNTLDNEYNKLCKAYFEKTSWLTPMNVSYGAQEVKNTNYLEYEIYSKENKKTVYCSKIVLGQKFMFYSKGNIKKISGASYTKISDNYYQIITEQSEFTIEF